MFVFTAKSASGDGGEGKRVKHRGVLDKSNRNLKVKHSTKLNPHSLMR